MSIYCQIPPYQDSDVFTHVETIWEISTTEQFEKENIIDTTRTSGEFLNVYVSGLTIPENATWYARATRVFQEDRNNEVLKPKPINNYNSVYNNNIIHADPVVVEKPFIYVNLTEFNDPDFIDFEVRTSQFRCNQDGHYCTHWIVTDIAGNVIYQYLNAISKEDKLFIRLNKVNDLLNKSIFIIHAIHVTSNGIESEKGTYYFNANKFSFDIVGLTSNLTPGEDAKLYIEPAVARDKFVNSVFLKITSQDGTITKGVDITPPPGNNVITIPGQELFYNSEYYLDIYCYNDYNEYTSRRLFLTTRKSTITSLYNPNFKYEKRLQEYPKNFMNGFSCCVNFTTCELPDKRVLIPKLNGDLLTVYQAVYSSDKNGEKIEINLGGSNLGFGTLPNIQLPSTTSNDILIKMLNDNMLLIDSYKQDTDGTNKPKFQVYLYDRIEKTFTLLHEDSIRSGERYALGKNNALFQYGIDAVIFLSNGTGSIMEYSFVNNRTSLRLEPDPDVKNAIKGGSMLFNRKTGKALIFGNTGKLFVYDPEMNELTESGDVPFQDWLGALVKPVELPNGDYVIINVGSLDPVSAPNSLVYYNSFTGEYTKLNYTQANANVNSLGTISGYSTSLFLVNNEFVNGRDTKLLARLY